MDFFKDLADIRHSFRLFAEKLPEDGLLIINGTIDRYEELTKDLPCRVLTYGPGAGYDYTAANVSYDDFARGSYDLIKNGENLGRISLQVPGAHNVSNSLATIAIAMELGIPVETIRRGLFSFTGTDRRFELKGTIHGINIIDDYAHHPTEITATLTAAGNYPHKTCWVAFQPHTYTRTKAFLTDFAKALSLADKVLLADIYAAREQNTVGITSRDLMAELKKLGTDTWYFPSFDEMETFFLEHSQPGDLLITMGAGDIFLVGEHLLGK